jgi:hypothetical protein
MTGIDGPTNLGAISIESDIDTKSTSKRRGAGHTTVGFDLPRHKLGRVCERLTVWATPSLLWGRTEDYQRHREQRCHNQWELCTPSRRGRFHRLRSPRRIPDHGLTMSETRPLRATRHQRPTLMFRRTRRSQQPCYVDCPRQARRSQDRPAVPSINHPERRCCRDTPLRGYPIGLTAVEHRLEKRLGAGMIRLGEQLCRSGVLDHLAPSNIYPRSGAALQVSCGVGLITGTGT